MYKTVLLAYNGTRECRIALREGAQIAALCGARVHLLAVMPLSAGVLAYDGINAGAILENDLEQFRAVLEEGLARLRARGLQAQGHLAAGDPVAQIARTAREHGADLVVLGHVPRRGLARWWQSSLGASLLDELDCSVLVAMRREAPA